MPPDFQNDVACAIRELAFALRDHTSEQKMEFNWMVTHHNFATKHDLEKSTQLIMSAISEFAAKQTAFNDRVDTAVTGLQGDIQTLNDLIEKLQTTPGPISAEDQASLDQLEARGDAIAAKLEALDALTPPVVPETPPTDPTSRRNA